MYVYIEYNSDLCTCEACTIAHHITPPHTIMHCVFTQRESRKCVLFPLHKAKSEHHTEFVHSNKSQVNKPVFHVRCGLRRVCVCVNTREIHTREICSF